jgi:hypothetical protein
MKKVLLSLSVFLLLLAAGSMQSAQASDDDCIVTGDCSTQGKSISQWCRGGSGNCLCEVVIICRRDIE